MFGLELYFDHHDINGGYCSAATRLGERRAHFRIETFPNAIVLVKSRECHPRRLAAAASIKSCTRFIPFPQRTQPKGWASRNAYQSIGWAGTLKKRAKKS